MPEQQRPAENQPGCFGGAPEAFHGKAASRLLPVYRALAQRLDAIPNGFPSTASGVELRLLAKIFAPEEAALAAAMRLTLEPAAAIAARAGVDPQAAYRTLKGMARKGQIRTGRGERELLFGLMPFVVGIYEAQLARLDAELASLFEQYYQETRGGFVGGEVTSVHRVIPVEQTIPVEIEIHPYERASQLIEEAKSWGVQDCICRLQQRLVGQGCDHEINNCLLFAPMENAFTASREIRVIDKAEALRILAESERAGLVHTVENHRQPLYYICNCCTCCCGILRRVAEFGFLGGVARSDFRATVDAATCAGCGDCTERCPFQALAVPEDICVVDTIRCVGCGLCAAACPTGALSLQRRPADEVPAPAVDMSSWMEQRARERGISIADVR